MNLYVKINFFYAFTINFQDSSDNNTRHGTGVLLAAVLTVRTVPGNTSAEEEIRRKKACHNHTMKVVFLHDNVLTSKSGGLP